MLTPNGNSNATHLTLLIGQGGVQTFHSLRPNLTIDTEFKTNADVQLSSIGSAGLWERGYHWSTSSIFDAIRRQLETMEKFEGMYFGYATAGGTGSGLSMHLIQETRDWLPKSYLIGLPILPYPGETPLQHYNTAVNLASFQLHADAVLLFPNQQLSADVGGSNLYPHDINAWACQLVQPVMDLPGGAWELITHLCPMSEFRFLHTTRSCTQEADWLSIIQNLCQHLWVPKSKFRSSCLSANAYLPTIFPKEFEPLLYNQVDRRIGFLKICDQPLRYDRMKQPSLEQRRISYSKNVSQAQITLIHHTASLSLHYLSNILKRTTGQLYVSAYKHCFSSNGWETIHSSCQILMDVMEKYENCLTEMTPTSI